MKSLSLCLALLCVTFLASTARADDKGKFSKELPTQMTERGKAILSEDFTGTALDPKWKTAKGKWEIANGILTGTERKEDNHAATLRTPLNYHDAIIQVSFKFDGGKQFSVSLNDKKGHVCRATVSLTKLGVAKDKASKNSTDKPERLSLQDIKLQPGQWYDLVLEVQGGQILASLTDGQVAYGENAGIDVDKSDFGLPVGGEGVSFGYVRIWEATPKKGWDKTKYASKK